MNAPTPAGPVADAARTDALISHPAPDPAVNPGSADDVWGRSAALPVRAAAVHVAADAEDRVAVAAVSVDDGECVERWSATVARATGLEKSQA